MSSNRRRGAEIQAERMCRRLDPLGWEVTLLSLSAADPPTISAEPLVDRKRLGRLDAGIVRRLRAELRRRAPDVVVAWGGASLRYVAVAGVATEVPLKCYVAVGMPSAWLRSPAHARWYRLLASRFDAIAAVSRATAADLVGAVGIDPGKLAVIPSGIPESFLDAQPPRPDGPLRVLFVGSFSAEKDPLACVEVMEAAAARITAELRMIGDGPMAAQVRQRAAASSAAVEIVGGVDDVLPHLGWCDVLLITSRTEGLPGVALEAMAAGRPVVGFDVGALGEAVADGETGFLVPQGDVDAAAAVLVELGGDRARLLSLGAAGREVIRSGHLAGQAAERFDRFLRDQLARATSITTDVSPR